MKRLIKFLIISSMEIFTKSLPLQNVLTMSSKEETTKKFGTLFAKIPQDPDNGIRHDIMSQSYISHSAELGLGCTNQIAKVIYPVDDNYDMKDSPTTGSMNFLNLPLLQQPYDNYKILVATAPSNFKMGTGKEFVIYVIFPEDDPNTELTPATTPQILFVSDKNDNFIKKHPIEPVFIIDSNRTVTGLKSKEILKFIKFRNKLTNRYNYAYIN